MVIKILEPQMPSCSFIGQFHTVLVVLEPLNWEYNLEILDSQK